MSTGRKYSILEAKSKLEALCAYQERCSYELCQKMIRWRLSPEDQDILLADLIANNFLSEERFAEAFVSGKVRIKRWGTTKIRMELKRRQISDYSIKKGLASIDPDEYWNNLRYLADRKWNDLHSEKNTFKRRGKVFRFLTGRGYETDLINDALDQINE